MSVIESLVFDRTQEDVDALEAFYAAVQAGTASLEDMDLASAKGAYNVSDLNRVTQAMEYLHGRLTEYGYLSGYVPVEIMHRDGTKDVTWREDDEDITVDKLEEYLSNVRALRSVFPTLPSTPEAPADMEALTVEDANAIERILYDLETVINAMRGALLRAGQVLLHSGGPAVYMLPAAQSGDPDDQTIYVWTADGRFIRTADGLYVTIGG